MEGTYEAELERAELLGVEPLSKEKFEEQAKARREAEIEQEQAEVAEQVEGDGEKIKGGHGKMEELSNILNSTQMKLNKFKTVCGSFTSLLKIRSGSPAPAENRGGPSTSGNSINDALDNLDEMKKIEGQSDIQFDVNQTIHQTQDIKEKASKNLDALDRLLNKTEKAEISLQNQNQQIKGYLRK